MASDRNAVPDPQWALTLAIRAALELHGRYVAEVDERDAQAVVDLHWASRQAGRLLGVKVTVDVGAPYGHADYIATATVQCVDDGGPERFRAEEGLQVLLNTVRNAHAPACAPLVVVPRPRRPQPAASA
jgi:hypothetical protein